MKVLVVGASSGLGAALTLDYLKQGYSVVATGRRISRIARILPARAKAALVQHDLLRPNSVRELVTEHGDVDLVYHCAAVVDPAPLSEMMWVNFEAFVQLVEEMDRVGRKIVAISSLAAVVPFDHLPRYCATKAALESWVVARRRKCASTIIIVRPGPFESELFQKSDTLERKRLPVYLAERIVRAVAQGHSDVFLGGWRDRLAAHLTPILGGVRTRRLILGS